MSRNFSRHRGEERQARRQEPAPIVEPIDVLKPAHFAAWGANPASRGRSEGLLHNPSTNQTTAFDRAQEEELHVLGMVPHRVTTLEEQAAAAIAQIRAKDTPLEQYIGMASLHDRNEVLFYRVLVDDIADLMLIVYTPTVGEACQKFSQIYRSARGLEAARAMADHRIGSVVVVEHGRVAGIVTDRDLVLDIVAQAVDPRETRLGAIMRRNVATIDLAQSVDDAVALMRANACRRIPLTENGHAVGIVTLDDLVLDRALGLDAIASVVGSQLELAARFSERDRHGEGRPNETSIQGTHPRPRKRHRSHADVTYHRLLDEVKENAAVQTREAAEVSARRRETAARTRVAKWAPIEQRRRDSLANLDP
jgi:CBS domain-containing protein